MPKVLIYIGIEETDTRNQRPFGSTTENKRLAMLYLNPKIRFRLDEQSVYLTEEYFLA